MTICPPPRLSAPSWLPDSDLIAGAVRASPAALFTVSLGAIGGRPDAWQVKVLTSTSPRIVIVSGRQLGKSGCAAAAALHTAAYTAHALVLIVSASERQAKIVLTRIRAMLPFLGPAAAGADDTQQVIRFANGSEIVVLPASSSSLRGWTADLLIIDEAAYVPRASWESVVPSIGATGGRILCITTPSRPSGWLYEVVTDHETYAEWERFNVSAEDVPRFDAAFLAAERRRLPQYAYDREYRAMFSGADDGVFDPEAVAAAFTNLSDPRLAGANFNDLLSS